MYKLVVVSGPNVGTSYALQEGEVTIGRLAQNVIVLPSAKVSKIHCKLVVGGSGLWIEDQGSSNGTYVNGVQTRRKQIQSGDKISVGETIFEIRRAKMRGGSEAPPAPGMGQVIPFPGSELPQAADALSVDFSTNPKDLKSKAQLLFETYVMPFFYGFNVRHEWRFLVASVFAVFLILNLVISVYPLLESNHLTVLRESVKRAQGLANALVDQNTSALAAGAETKTTVGNAEREAGVRVAMVVDLKNRIIAPPTRMNQYLSAPPEGSFAIRMSNEFQKGRETGSFTVADDDIVIWAEPIKLMDSRLGKNVVVALAIVSIDAEFALPGMGSIGLIYSKVFILTTLLGALVLLILYRLTLKPFENLNSDFDKALKGEMSRVKPDFKFEEVNSLWDLVNSAIQRIPRNASGLSVDNSSEIKNTSKEDFVGVIQMIGEFANFGLIFCDENRRIVFLNSRFEEMSGIRNQDSVDQEINAVARDQALGAFCNDLFDRVLAGSDSIVEEYDFGGVIFKVHAVAVGSSITKGYCLAFVKQEGSSS